MCRAHPKLFQELLEQLWAHHYLNFRTVKGNNCYCHYDGRGELQIWCKTKTGGIANSTSTRKRVARLFRLKEDRRSGPHDRRRRRPQFSVTKERPDWPPDDGWIRPSPHRRDLPPDFPLFHTNSICTSASFDKRQKGARYSTFWTTGES